MLTHSTQADPDFFTKSLISMHKVLDNKNQEFYVLHKLILSKEQAYVAHLSRLKFMQNSNPVVGLITN